MSGKYRKKPVVIEAHYWDHEESARDWPDWLEEAYQKEPDTPGSFFCGHMNIWYIRTLEGAMTVSDNDYIIRGVKGELYPCKPDIFEATYDPA